MRKISAGLIATLLLLVTALAAVNAFAVAKPMAEQTPEVTVAGPDAPLENAEWTIIIYLAADNNLQAAGLGDLGPGQRARVHSLDPVRANVPAQGSSASARAHAHCAH